MSSQVGVAQQWYDELDNLASLISPPESELNEEDDSTTSEVGFQNGKVFIDCVVNTSPGTSEVCTFSLYLYLFCFGSFESNRISGHGSDFALTSSFLALCRLLFMRHCI